MTACLPDFFLLIPFCNCTKINWLNVVVTAVVAAACCESFSCAKFQNLLHNFWGAFCLSTVAGACSSVDSARAESRELSSRGRGRGRRRERHSDNCNCSDNLWRTRTQDAKEEEAEEKRSSSRRRRLSLDVFHCRQAAAATATTIATRCQREREGVRERRQLNNMQISCVVL